MESQLVREQDRPATVGLHSFVEGEVDERFSDEKGVLKKVKAKAKKLTESIAKHGHEHEQGRCYRGLDDRDLDEGDEEAETDPEVHGAPIYESEVFVTGVSPRSGGLKRVESPREEAVPAPANTPATTPHCSSPALGTDRVPDQTIDNFLRPFRAEEDPHSPTRRNHPANYQTKVSDPSGLGAQEVDVSSLIQSARKLTIASEPESRMEQDNILTTGTGSHHHFSPEMAAESNRTEDDGDKLPTQKRYTEKIISLIADKVTSAKDIIVSKLGFSDKDRSSPETSEKDCKSATDHGEEASFPPPTKGIAAVVTEKLSPVYEKAVQTGSTVVSRVRGDVSTGRDMATEKSQEKGASARNYLAEKLKPGEEDKALSDMIKGALHMRKREPAAAPVSSGSDDETKTDVDVGKERGEERSLQGSTI
ncbi:hypothetical protein MLD38_030371 [Melastoma candidum]|uniref:Uncharacterized protein n=1 Tax=Melastoma candidum TaxID=119954 RepID=A0ACB9MLM1_9MYRT|nr:hypothetical protein MLD38_030371 [Melastoma candidum]